MEDLPNAHAGQGANGATGPDAEVTRHSLLHSLKWGVVTSVVVFFLARLTMYLLYGTLEFDG